MNWSNWIRMRNIPRPFDCGSRQVKRRHRQPTSRSDGSNSSTVHKDCFVIRRSCKSHWKNSKRLPRRSTSQLNRHKVNLEERDFSVHCLRRLDAPPSPSPVTLRPRDELTLSDSWSSGASSSRLSQRLSGTSNPTPQSPSSFTNPLHNPFRSTPNTSPRTSQISVPSSPPAEERRSSGSIVIPNLVEFEGLSSDVQHPEFTVSSNSHASLLDDDSQPTSPESVSRTPLLKPEEVNQNRTQSGKKREMSPAACPSFYSPFSF